MTSSEKGKYIVAGCKPWNRSVFKEVISRYPGKWFFVSGSDELTTDFVKNVNPEYIFFLHWSWLVPEEIFGKYECVCFHMTDVPYGRGGSPLQNLIVRGHTETRLTALRMVRELDAGPVYYKETLSLEGSAEEIYIRAAHLSARLIERFINEHPVPVEQTGEVVSFKRRKPHQSEILQLATLGSLYDFIRMLDAEGYPKAFLSHQGFRYEFNRAALLDGSVEARVTITREEDSDN
jgi:methionyl-tRNA formyltransferase